MAHISEKEAQEKIWAMIKNINIALMVTQDEKGRFHARPMGTQKTDKNKAYTGELWFLTKETSPKVEEIRHNPNVLLSYAEPKTQDYVSVAGKAEILKDRAKIKEFWHEPYRLWFPDGPNDPEIVLVRVQAEAAEYWDAPSKSIVYAYGYFKSKLTGGSNLSDPAENKKVSWQ